LPRAGRLLVVDASVASRSGGPGASDTAAKICRDFLLCFKSLDHRMVLNTTLRGEWNRHQSGFARGWRLSMVAAKRVSLIEDAEIPALRDGVVRLIAGKNDQADTLKDCHLIETAIQADRSVVSLDERVRSLFTSVAQQLPHVRETLWVNPEIPTENALDWLERGARYDAHRLLGH
jgi:hypothetical protein